MGVAMGALGAASSIVSGLEARSAAQKAEEAQDYNNLIIRQQAANSYGDLSSSERFIQKERHQQTMSDHASFLRAKGEVMAQAAASGTYGGAVDDMVTDLVRTKGANLATINNNAKFKMDDIALQKEEIRLNAQRSQGTQVFEKPSMLSIGLNAAISGMKGYNAGSSLSASSDLASPASSVASSNWDVSMNQGWGR